MLLRQEFHCCLLLFFLLQNPKLIHFLTVKDTGFAFSVGIEKKSQAIDFSEFKENSLSELLKSALEEKGVGAKTAVGYGYFSNIENASSHFKKCYDALIKEEKRESENAKPLSQKISENISSKIDEAFEFIQNEKNSKNEKAVVINKMREHFSDEEVWSLKKRNGHQFQFANLVHDFLGLINEKDVDIIALIKRYGSKKLKKKYK